MKELLEEFLGKKLRNFRYNEGVFGNREPHYQCVLEDDTDVTVNTVELWVFLYRLASDKYSKTLEKLSDDHITNSKEVYYKLTSIYALYYNGESIIFKPGKNLDYEALTLCLRKINHEFRGHHIGLPRIGCGIAGGNWVAVKKIIEKELIDCDVTIVNYVK